MIDLQGKAAWVTGGSRGIGRAVAQRLAEQGAEVVINYVRHRSHAEETVAAIEERGQCLAIKANLDDFVKPMQPKNVHHKISMLRSRGRRSRGFLRDRKSCRGKEYHGNVCNAAEPVFASGYRDSQRCIRSAPAGDGVDSTTLGLGRSCQCPCPIVAGSAGLVNDASRGRIVAIFIDRRGACHFNSTVVGGSKGALESLVRHLAVELEPRGITINTVSAGVVETDALKKFPNREAILAHAMTRTPLGRLTTPEDVADVVLLLCSELAAMIHGQVVVDGVCHSRMSVAPPPGAGFERYHGRQVEQGCTRERFSGYLS